MKNVKDWGCSVPTGSKKTIAENIEEAAKILRNCRKIEHRIYQLQKQLYLGNTAAYNILMKLQYPDYMERKKQNNLFSQPFKDNSKLDEIEKNMTKQGGKDETRHPDKETDTVAA